MAIWAMLIKVWVILNKPLSARNKVSVSLKKLGTGIRRGTLLETWVEFLYAWVILKKQLSVTNNSFVLQNN